ncbi:MAG: peroxiredoxin [Alphaproteobacteria bacterium]
MARIKVGERVPEGTLQVMTKSGPSTVTTKDVFKGKKVALFSVPGAFTPTCSGQHLPGYVRRAKALKAKGIDTIACVAVNDAYVMDAWGRDRKVGKAVAMLADGNGTFTKSLGLAANYGKYGLGRRGQRFSMVIDNGVVRQIYIERGGGLKVSDADTMLSGL